MTTFFGRRLTTQLGTPGLGTFIPGAGMPGASGPTRPQRPSDDVIQGEVIDPDQK
jgi:UPF0716 protein FxsA